MISTPNPALNTMIYEIFQYANDIAANNKAEAAAYLQKNRSRVVIEGLLKLTYDPAVEWQLPAGRAPYKRDTSVPDGFGMTDLKQEFRRLKVFTDTALNLNKMRREQLWLQMCEGLFWKEADIINYIKDRNLVAMFPNLNAEFVRFVFPELLPQGTAKPIVVNETKVEMEDPSKISEEDLVNGIVTEDGRKVLHVDIGDTPPAVAAEFISDMMKAAIESGNQALIDFVKKSEQEASVEVAKKDTKKPVKSKIASTAKVATKKPVQKKVEVKSGPRLKKDGTPWGKTGKVPGQPPKNQSKK